MKKYLALVLSALLIFSLLVGCGGTTTPEAPPAPTTGEESSGGTATPAPGGSYTIALSSQHLTNDFNRGVLKGVQDTAAELGFELVTANAQGDSNQQVADVENFLTMDVDAILIGGGEAPAFANVMKKATEAGIPVITLEVASEYTSCNITSDNHNGGEQLGHYVTNRLHGEGNILLLDTPGWLSLVIRIRMLESVIEDYPNLNIVQTISIPTEDAVNNYAREVKAYLQGNPDIDCIYCSWGLAAVGASQALREMGLTDEIFVVCTDADQAVLEEMRKDDSPLAAVVGQYPEELGSLLVTQAANALAGNEMPLEAYAPIILITKENPEAWFSAPAIMTTEEVWPILYPDA